jgi:methylated-DNA-[protein]-cysteine S-methyltransferase
MKLPTNLYCTDIHTPLGTMRLAANEQALVGAWFHNQRHAPDAAAMQPWTNRPDHPVLCDAEQQLQAYFARKRVAFKLPLALSYGTAFQRAVWQALLDIDAGHTMSYGALAQRLSAPAAVRAVAAAVGRNPISIVVPCHRVLGARGELTGYAGGLPRKAALLQLEAGAKPAWIA